MSKCLILLDASAMKKSHCGRLLYWSFLQGYRTPLNDHSAEWGQGFHVFTKRLEETNGNIGKAQQEAVKYFRAAKYEPNPKKKHLTELTLARTCQDYFDGPYQSDPFDTLKDFNDKGDKEMDCVDAGEHYQFPKGRPIVEKRFAIDLYESDTVKILLCGTMDKLVVHRTSKLLCVGDYKTSSSWNANEYLDSYELNNQLYTYVFALRRLIDSCSPDSVFNQFRGREIRAFIDGVFPSMQNGSFKVEFKRSKVFEFKEKPMKEYEAELMCLCEHIDKLIIADKLPAREGIMRDTCGMYGGCDFADACKMEWDKERQKYILEKNFIVKPYNPMSHGE